MIQSFYALPSADETLLFFNTLNTNVKFSGYWYNTQFNAELVNAAWKEPGKEVILSLTIFNAVADLENKPYTIELI